MVRKRSQSHNVQLHLAHCTLGKATVSGGERTTGCWGLGEGLGVTSKGLTGGWSRPVRECVKVHKTAPPPNLNGAACYFENKRDISYRENTNLYLNILKKN